MRRLLAIVSFILCTQGIWAQSGSVGDAEAGFQTFSAAFAPTLLYTATMGNDWSSAHIGNFPNWGLGVTAAASAVRIEDINKLCAALRLPVPDKIRQIGMPVPVILAGFKIGGYKIPFDIGLKGMYVSRSMMEKMPVLGVQSRYLLLGGNIRFALVKDEGYKPAFSLGVGYNYFDGYIAMQTDAGHTAQYAYTDTSGSHTLSVTSPRMDFSWRTHSVDCTAQISKKILFIEPFLGIGLSAGKSQLKTGVTSSLLKDGTPLTTEEAEALKNYLHSTGSSISELTPGSIAFTADSSKPAFRVYGGLTLSVFLLKLDFSLMYVPQNRSYGASVMLRIQM